MFQTNANAQNIHQPEAGTGSFFIPETKSDQASGVTKGLLKKTATPVAGVNGYYDVTLTLKPTQASGHTTVPKTDIVLVIDKSSSMSSNDMKSIRSAAGSLVDKVLQPQLASSVRVAVVGFSGPSKTFADTNLSNSTVNKDFSNNATEIKNFLNTKLSAGGGTNTEAGMEQAYNYLKGSSASQKYVVFFSDGEATFRLTKVKEKVQTGYENQTVNYGTGYSDDNGYNKACAMAWADAIKAPVGQTVKRSVGSKDGGATIQNNGLGAKMFAVGYGVDLSDYATPNTDSTTYYFPANKASDFIEHFKIIEQSIVDSMTISNTVVTDRVSNQFSIVSKPGEFQVEGLAIENGKYVTVDGQDITVPFGSITSTSQDRTVTIRYRVKLREDACLEAGTYELSTNDFAKVSYRIDDTEYYQNFNLPYVKIVVDKNKYGMSKTASLVNWQQRQYQLNVSAWSQAGKKTVFRDKTDITATGTVTADDQTTGKSYLVYTGTGSNDPVSQNVDDYRTAAIQSRAVQTGVEQYWMFDSADSNEKYTGKIYKVSGYDQFLFWQFPRYSQVTGEELTNPSTNESYYGVQKKYFLFFSYDAYVLLSFHRDGTTETQYYWEDLPDQAGASRTVYDVKTTQVPVQTDDDMPVDAATDVMDVVDSRFEIMSVTPTATVSGNTVTWKLDSLTGSAQDPGFTGIIVVKAKDSFVGGNNVATNVANESGLKIGRNSLKPFANQPTVNVKADIAVADTERTIFLGEAVPADGSILTDMNATKSGVDYTWAGEQVSNATLPANYVPTADNTLVYTLTSKLAMQAPTDFSNKNSGGYFNGTADNQYTLTDSGKYTVKFISGQLTITKTVVDKNNKETVPGHEKQGFLFHVSKNGKAFCDVVLLPGETPSASKTLTHLPKGTYTVSEDTAWAWRYQPIGSTQTSVAINSQSSAVSASFKNQLKNTQWLEDKDAVTNQFALGEDK